jgi:hypothetical protein
MIAPLGASMRYTGSAAAHEMIGSACGVDTGVHAKKSATE